MKTVIHRKLFLQTGEIVLDEGDPRLEVIRNQPGYIWHAPKSLLRSSSGDVRLYVEVSGRWRDASLSGIDDPSVIALCDSHLI